MSIRISNLRLSLDEPEAGLSDHLTRALGIRANEVSRWRILRKSLDARRKDALQFVYTIEVSCPADESGILMAARKRHHDLRVDQYQEPAFELPPSGARPL